MTSDAEEVVCTPSSQVLTINTGVIISVINPGIITSNNELQGLVRGLGEREEEWREK